MDFRIHSLIPLNVIELYEAGERSLGCSDQQWMPYSGYTIAGPTPVCPKGNDNNLGPVIEDVPEVRIGQLPDLVWLA
jgi:hypothetical protein